MIEVSAFYPFGAIDTDNLLAVSVTALLSGSLVAAVTAYRKAGPEREAIISGAALQVTKDLREELERREKAHGEELERLTKRHAIELGQRDDQIGALRERVGILERRLNGEYPIDPPQSEK